ncbi:CPBP family intramembrane glutamic endopeptidase [Sphingomonas astaxanthinifaciens]|uniref:CAAX prenyl protease 2/Lysostaphin resistance protein A-like domain-containing protein n=1 Tax=Sphingomonas astaxanthinifaciens DSM 22298 TaxID=1123267 RepID=A0ABQ5Z1H5_9SPHN|nr:CPBP family intramembrane glutamic endopeptidase [Sphingomonas astaxanthinifaciens]GLR46630.1 hypothetical protein GCM10007925_03410 [Sphingomonas astaxanthinifaciens DSM 22298]
MAETLFSSEPHRGWLPPAWAAPLVCILLVALSSTPFDYALEALGLVGRDREPSSPLAFCLFLVIPFAAMGAAVWAWSRFVERRPLATMGLTGEHRLRRYLAGMGIGIAMMTLATTAIWLAGGYQAKEILPAFFEPGALPWMLLLLAGFAFQSGVEEYIFRGWLLSTATRQAKLAAGFIASSLAFTFLHFSPHQPFREMAMTFTFGLFACAWAWRANSIWGVMGWHAGWNWITGVGFGVPITGFDLHLPALLVHLVPKGSPMLTGGPAGPESSILTTGMLAAGTLLLLAWPRRFDEERGARIASRN